MRRYTTPTETVILRGANLTECDIYVTYRQGSKVILTVNDIESTFDGTDTILTYELSQQDTAKFKAGAGTIQVNWITPENKRDATDEKPIDAVTRNNLEVVLVYGEHTV